MGIFARIILGAFCLALVPVVAAAQTSTIAGTVKDVSGAILPWVTVEVASHALIEKVRSAISDGSILAVLFPPSRPASISSRAARPSWASAAIPTSVA